jgi:hypothetical protein
VPWDSEDIAPAARDGRDGALTVHQDADPWVACLAVGQEVSFAPRPGRVQGVQLTDAASARRPAD